MRTPITYDALAGALGVSRSALGRDPRALELAGPHRSGEVRQISQTFPRRVSRLRGNVASSPKAIRSVGRIGKLECDFFARRGDSYAYVQVSMTIASPEVERREYAPFGRIRDGWPRFLFTFDPLRSQRDGVHHLNLMEFLKANSDLF